MVKAIQNATVNYRANYGKSNSKCHSKATEPTMVKAIQNATAKATEPTMVKAISIMPQLRLTEPTMVKAIQNSLHRMLTGCINELAQKYYQYRSQTAIKRGTSR